MTCPGGCIGGGGQPKDKNFSGDGCARNELTASTRETAR